MNDKKSESVNTTTYSAENKNLEVLPAKSIKEVDDKLVEEAARYIKEVAANKIYEGHVEIGKYILEKFFNNDSLAATSRNPYKSASYSKLCDRQDIGFSATSLSRMLRVACQDKMLTEKGIETSKIHYTQKMILLQLPDDQKKLDIINNVIDSSMSSRELSLKIREIKSDSKPVIKINAKKTINKLNRISSNIDEFDQFKGRDVLENLTEESRTKIKTLAENLDNKITSLKKQLKSILDAIDKYKVPEKPLVNKEKKNKKQVK